MADEVVSQSNAILLARIDERTQGTVTAVQEIKAMVTANYVTQQEFKPVKMIVFGFVGLVLMAVIGAMIALVLATRHA